MPAPALLILAATLLPLASFVALTFVGRRLGEPLAGLVATLAIAGSFGCSLGALASWLGGGDGWGYDLAPFLRTVPWLDVGGSFLDVGLYLDSLTIAMFVMVSTVSLLVHVFSIGYMRGDPRFARFFTYLGLFCFSMFGLVASATILQLFIFWELVGLCSYLLIGFWYEKRSASNAAIKAFVVNRIGDFGFLIGMGLLFAWLGNLTLPDLWATLGLAARGADVILPHATLSQGLLTLIGVGLFCGAIGKSAQFPLHVWLPDAMEGPTPVSALIHAATMVAAGVYMVARIFPILTPDARLAVALIGGITLTLAALIALVQTDIKKVLAYSTVSQLGYMILALGIGSWIGGLFHLLTHAFFKALLFLAAGSVIVAAHHEQDLRRYGGLWRRIPVTAATFAIAVLAIAGTPFFSGYFSKDLILADAGAFAWLAEHTGRGTAWWLLFGVPAAVAYLTAFYMMRCWMLTFAGRPRDARLHEHARETPLLYGPLVVLALLSIVAGYQWFPVRNLVESALAESQRMTVALAGEGDADRRFAFTLAWPARHAEPAGEDPASDEPDAHAEATPTPGSATDPDHAVAASVQARREGEHAMHRYVGWAWLIGIGAAGALYAAGPGLAARIARLPPVCYVHAWLLNKLYIDELYDAVFVGLTRAISRLTALIDRRLLDAAAHLAARSTRGVSALVGLHDRHVVDGLVNGAAWLSHRAGDLARLPQTGNIRVYVMLLMVAVGVALAGVALAVLTL